MTKGTSELVELDVTPDRWQLIQRSRLAFGLLAADIMMLAPRQMIVTREAIHVIVPEHMRSIWDLRPTQRTEKLLFLAQRTQGAMCELTEFLDGGWIP